MGLVFISHVAEDSALALQIAQGLEEAGISTWFYERDSLPGPSYLDQILRALDRSTAVVALLSLAALTSIQVDKEIVQAHERGLPFVPLLHGLTYEQVREQRPAWVMAFGAAVAVSVAADGVAAVLQGIIAGMRWLATDAEAAGAGSRAHGERVPLERPSVGPAPVVLPTQPTPFIGREREIAAVRARLLAPETRLLTLTGAGGIGKTRLAVEVARSLEAGSNTATAGEMDSTTAGRDGIYLVDLATLVDPTLVLPTIAQTLGLAEVAGETPLQTLTAALRERQVLLVLDNFEQVLDAAPRVSEMLAACAGVRVLVTSRAALRVRGERIYPVPPLGLPARHAHVTPDALCAYDAVRLFLARAQEVQPEFALTPQSAPVVAEICARLDGLPLAIELVAARVRVVAPEALLARLSNRLKVATGGARDLPARQQTLRAAIDWSYGLLDPGEQQLFTRLAVFAGSWTLEAAEAVCDAEGDLPLDVLNGVESLLDKSLLRRAEEDGEARYAMLETLHEYAREKLAERGETEALRVQHAAYFRALAEEAAPHLNGVEQATWLARLEAEHDNVRAALRWAQERAENAEVGLRLAAALWRFWDVRGYFGEGRHWLEEMIARAQPAAGEMSGTALAAPARVLYGAGLLAWRQGDYTRARVLYEESLVLSRELGDRAGIAYALESLGVVADVQGDYARATLLYEESLTLFRELGDKAGIALTLDNMGVMAWHQGDRARASVLWTNSVALFREVGDMRRIAGMLNNLGLVANRQGDYARATHLYEESEALFRELGDRAGIAITHDNLAGVAARQGNYARATCLYEENLALFRNLGDQYGIAYVLTGLADVACAQGDTARAIRLYEESLALRRELGDRSGIAKSLEGWARAAMGPDMSPGTRERAALLLSAADALRAAIGAPRPSNDQPDHERTVANLRAVLGEAAFTTAWTQGQALSLDQALALALDAAPSL